MKIDTQGVKRRGVVCVFCFLLFFSISLEAVFNQACVYLVRCFHAGVYRPHTPDGIIALNNNNVDMQDSEESVVQTQHSFCPRPEELWAEGDSQSFMGCCLLTGLLCIPLACMGTLFISSVAQ